MFGSNVLEVLMSVIFVYILLSLLCSTINEQVIVRLLSLRAKVLEEGIINMLNDPTLIEQLYHHPLIKGLSFSQTRSQAQKKSAPSSTPAEQMTVHKPSYIPSDIFALALRDVLQQRREAGSLPDFSLPTGVQEIFKRMSIDPEKDLRATEVWFDSTMDRVSGWYKRRVQIFIFLLGLLIAVGLNIDTISLILTVSHNETVRATLVSAAQGYTTQHSPNLTLLQSDIDQIQPMIGWYGLPTNFQDWLLKIIGLLTTTIAVSLGAPFWFDVLNKIVSFRSSGPPPASTSSSSLLTTPLSLVVKNNSPLLTTPVLQDSASPTTPLPQSTAMSGIDTGP